MGESIDLISKIYHERDEMLILGLTGRTGSGCSTLASILSQKDFSGLDLPKPKTKDFNTVEERQYEIIYNFMEKDRWTPFNVIEVSSLILFLILLGGEDDFINFLSSIQESGQLKILDFEGLKTAIKQMGNMFTEAAAYKRDFSKSVSRNYIEDKEYFLNTIKRKKSIFQNTLKSFSCKHISKDVFTKKRVTDVDLYSYILQTVGNNLRSSGYCYASTTNHTNNLLINLIDYVVRLIIKSDKNSGLKTRICIDALRNSFEIESLRDKYKPFYAVSVNVEDAIRKSRLLLSKDALDHLDEIEYPNQFTNNSELVYHQNIQTCIEISDIHIYNPPIVSGKYYELTQQIIKYIALHLHPGLVSPSKIERSMQLAYNAKFNSGCLSRKVGSVITGDDFSIRAIGWNDVPQDQVPCNLRNIYDYTSNRDKETFSKYELEDKEFSKKIEAMNKSFCNYKDTGIPCSYCFKDVHNNITGKSNQVHTRSLHAEENAFLQLAKYGGVGIRGGKLFVTASPCELCSKKSYQLGIREIYYIDPYPGISKDHILNFGKNSNPKLILFAGVIGNAYISLYAPKLALKDELALLVNKSSFVLIDVAPKERCRVDDFIYSSISADYIICNDSVIFNRKDKIKNLNNDPLCKIERLFAWTAGRYESCKYSKNISVEHNLENSESKSYSILFKNPLEKGQESTFNIQFTFKDTTYTPTPNLSYHVDKITKNLTMSLKCKRESSKQIGKVYLVVYANKDGEKYEVNRYPLEKGTDGDFDLYKMKISNPILFYTYSIEW